jgi:hypothetical protein
MIYKPITWVVFFLKKEILTIGLLIMTIEYIFHILDQFKNPHNLYPNMQNHVSNSIQK